MISPNIPVNKLVERLIESGDGSEEALAHKLKVSASTVSRWRSGSARPRPSIEGQLRQLALTQSDTLQLREDYDLFSDELSEAHLKTVITNTLREVREILHRTGRLSSRHEALDEVGKLLFAHVMSIGNSGTGISRRLLANGSSPAIALQCCVKAVFDQHLPQSLSHELQAQDFTLRLKESENRFALEIIDCFDRLASRAALAKIQGPHGVDILNDTFGQFLADSFVDEKELGQYLTPTEVVKFMVQLGLDSIDRADLDKFCGFRPNSEAGYILDPSCGVGSFLSEVFRTLYRKVSQKADPETLKRWTKTFSESSLVGIDKSERMIKLALTNLAMFGVPTANLHLANALVRTGSDASVTNSLEGKAKLILTNPPFGATFPIGEIARYRIASRWCRNPLRSADSEVLFMERYIDWLAPGGILVAIVPDSILTNRSVFEDLRNGLSPLVEILSVVSLPQVTFGVAGTNTKTSIIHLRKRSTQANPRRKAYCAVCENIGYEVSSRGAHRTKVATGTSDLGPILAEATHQTKSKVGTFVEFQENASRWDATYHAGSPILRKVALDRRKSEVLRVRDVADLILDRENPERRGDGSFHYIEIADVDGLSCDIRSKPLKCDQAPSRARKPVKAGDVLVSTVRPERRTIGVVPRSLDGAICSTGFAVLRPKQIDPLVLARLLQADISNAQILRNNSGIAYPVIDESCLPDVVLPIAPADLNRATAVSEPLLAAKSRVSELELTLGTLLKDLLERWNQG
jgi:transcriptional regulator with XRE-family HTH domain